MPICSKNYIGYTRACSLNRITIWFPCRSSFALDHLVSENNLRVTGFAYQKKLETMKKTNTTTVVRLVAAMLCLLPMLNSCVKDNSGLLNDEQLQSHMVSATAINAGANTPVNIQKLYAGQNIWAGSVRYDNIDTDGDGVNDALRVTFSTIDGWQIMEAHLFVGTSLQQMPVTRSGNPQVGQFPFKSGALPAPEAYQFTIPFVKLGFQCPNPNGSVQVVAAHASLRRSSGAGWQTETGWGEGQRLVERGSWAMFNRILLTCQPQDKNVPATTETAFAFDGDQTGCFQQYGQFLDNPQRWGWTNGPYDPGTYTFKLYAGAGLCDVSKGTLVGKVSMIYDGSTANVTYTLLGKNPQTGIPYTLREVHLYVGGEEFPRITNGSQAGDFTIAPGRFPYKSTNLTSSTQSFTVPNLSGKLYLIAHAVVHGFPE